MAIANVGALSDKASAFYGTNRVFFTGLSLTSGTAYGVINPSGTNSGFGSAGNEYTSRVTIVTSGTTPTTVNVSYDAGSTIGFTYYSNESNSQDGLRVGSIWIRSAGAVDCRVQLM